MEGGGWPSVQTVGMLDGGSLVESTPSFRRAPSSLSYSSRNFLKMSLKGLDFYRLPLEEAGCQVRQVILVVVLGTYKWNFD